MIRLLRLDGSSKPSLLAYAKSTKIPGSYTVNFTGYNGPLWEGIREIERSEKTSTCENTQSWTTGTIASLRCVTVLTEIAELSQPNINISQGRGRVSGVVRFVIILQFVLTSTHWMVFHEAEQRFKRIFYENPCSRTRINKFPLWAMSWEKLFWDICELSIVR